MALFLRIVAAISGAALLVIQALIEVDVYHNPTWIVVALVIVVAFASLVDNTRASWRAARAEDRERRYARIQKAATAALVEISERTGVELPVMGASVFKVHRRVHFAWSWPFLRRERILSRVLRFRLSYSPQPSTVVWTSGKGAIGQCLHSGRAIHKDWSPIARRYAKKPPTEQKYATLPAETRSGFTYREFVGIAGKYAEILAVPIMSEDGASILGVISIDRPYDPTRTAKVLDTSEARVIAEAAVAAIRADL